MELNSLENKISVEVVYGTPTSQKIIEIKVDPQATVQSAIQDSGIIAIYPEIDLSVNAVGIWNRAVKLTDTLTDLDRVEIYRPLLADPKEVRKRRAEKAKEEGRANKITGGRVKPL